MDKKQIRILLIEDSPVDVIFLREALGQDALNSFDLTTVERLHAALEILQKNTFDIILLDLGLPDSQGLRTFTQIHQAVPRIPKIVLSGLTDETVALQTVHIGAQDYIVKGTVGFSSAARAIRYAIERQRSREELRTSEERFRAIIEHGLDDISLLDAEGNLIWESPAVVRNLGYIENQFLGHSIFELMHPDDIGWTTELFRKLAQEPGAIQSGVFRLQHSDGSWRWVEAIVTNLLNSPSVQAIVVNYRDITKRKQAEEKLRESEERYRNLVEMSPNGIAVHQNGVAVFVNPASVRILGAKSPEELIGQPIMERIHPDYRALTIERVQRLIHGEEVKYPVEDRYLKMDGTDFPVEVTATQITYQNSPAIQLVVRDITERKQAEQQLRASEQEYRSLAESFDSGIATFDIHGTLRYINSVAAKDLGNAPEMLVGKNMFELFPAREAERQMQTIQRVIADGKGVVSEAQSTIATGSRWYRTSVQPIQTEADAVSEVLINLVDITERKQAEIEIKQRNDDLNLINVINVAVVQGKDLGEIMTLLAQELKRIFSSESSGLYILDPGGKSLTMQQYIISPKIRHQIEKVIGSTIPLIQIPIQESGYFQRVLSQSQGSIISDPREIQGWMAEFVETTFVPPVARGAFRKLIPQIYKLLNIQSVITVPLSANGKTIGLMDVSSENLFTDEDLRRIESISGQLTAAIQRQQTNEKVRRSEEFLQSVQNALSAHIAILNEEGTIVQVNSVWRTFAEQNGLDNPNYGIGTNYLEVCDSATGPDAEEASAAAQAIRGVIAGHIREALVEYPCHSPEKQRWFILRVTKFEDADHIWVVVAHENITERKQIEEKLRETSDQFRTLFEASPEAIMIVDPHDDWLILDCNATGCSMNGYTRAELVGQSVDIFNLTPGNPTQRSEYLESVHKAGVLRYETAHRRKDGTIFPIEVSTSVITLGGREVVLGIDRDITERKQAETALQQSEQRYRALFEDMPVAIWEQDFSDTKKYLDALRAEGILDFHEYFTLHPEAVIECANKIRLIDVNNAALHMYQTTSKEDLFQNTYQEMSPGEKKHSLEDYMALAEGKTSNSWDGSDTTLRGEPIEISLSWSVVPGYEADFSKVIVTTIDITERKRVEEALKQSEERFSKAFQSSPMAQVISHFADGQIIDVNTSFLSLFGYSHNSEVLGHRSVDLNMFAHPDERKRLAELIVKQGSIYNYEITIQTKYKELRQAILSIERIAIGKEDCVLTAIIDITERKRAENELRASEERFRQLADNIQEIFWITDAVSGEDLYISPAGERVWGHSVEELMRVPDIFINTVLPDDRSMVLSAIEKQRNGQPTEIEYRVVHPDGSEHWIWDRAFPIFDGSGKVLRLAGIAADITERKQANNALHQSEARLRQVIDLVPHFIFAKDVDGQFILVNQAVADAYGTTVAGLTGKFDADFAKSDEEVSHFRTDDMDVIDSGQAKFIPEESITDAGGNLRILSTTKIPFIFSGSPTPAVLGVSIDVTEDKKREHATRRHLAELEALYENGLAVVQLLDTREIGERIIDTFSNHLSWHHVAIRLRKPGSDELELVAFNFKHLIDEGNIPDHAFNFVASVSQVGQGLSGWVVQTGNPIRTGALHEHPQYVATYQDMQSGLYMPLKIRENCLGVISVESEAADAFSEQDERLLATLANQAAIAFENARLYQSVQRELLERQRTQEDLRISETHYRELANSITDIFFELDHDLHYTHWNSASELLTGVPADAAIGKSMRDIFGESEEQTRIEQLYKKVLEEHQPKNFETIFTVHAQPGIFEVNAYPSNRGVSVVAKDVTERKRSELILQKRFELMEFAAQYSLEEIMQRTIEEVSNLTGSQIGFFHILETDQATPSLQIWTTHTLSLFNIPVSEGQHQSVEQAGVWAEALRQRRALIHNEYESLPNKHGLPTGHAAVTREMVIPIIRSEKILAVVGIANKPGLYTNQDLDIAERFIDYAWDVTERKRMEVALAEERNQLAKRVEERTSDLSRANSNLARALRVKDEFLANMSHELRTPLNAILGLSESLAEQTAGPLNEKQMRYITTVGESGHHLLSLINDILDLAKIEAGQITLEVGKVDIQSVCDASLRMIKQLAQKKNQETLLKIDQNLGLMWADERRLKQMLVNLLSNAVKFTPEGGKLGLEVHGNQDENRVTFTIWDTGIGIKQADLSRLFQPFVQLDSGLARESSGTGLGLALVAQMARMHGGSTSVISEPGKGSHFSIMLPWEPALAMDTIERLKSTGKFRPVKFSKEHKPTILLIEDTEEVIMMVSDYLELNGFNIITAQDGLEGVLQAQLTHPDLILMDIQMPRMDGFEATKKLRSEPEFAKTPIIGLTALAMPNDRERCLEAGMDEYITKPVHLRVLVRIIENFLGGEKETKPQ